MSMVPRVYRGFGDLYQGNRLVASDASMIVFDVSMMLGTMRMAPQPEDESPEADVLGHLRQKPGDVQYIGNLRLHDLGVDLVDLLGKPLALFAPSGLILHLWCVMVKPASRLEREPSIDFFVRGEPITGEMDSLESMKVISLD